VGRGAEVYQCQGFARVLHNPTNVKGWFQSCPQPRQLAHTCIRNKDAVASCTCSFALLHRPYPACSLHVVVTVRAPEIGPTAPWGISMYNLVFSVLGLVQSPSHHTSLPPSRNTRSRSSFFFTSFGSSLRPSSHTHHGASYHRQYLRDH
jgi:hypothetical protein